ncbi:MAG: DegV family protein [Eubacterium sp.]
MIRILVDASSDYGLEEIKEKNIELVPIKITIGEKEYTEGVNLGRDQFYEMLSENEGFPKTSQPSPQEFVDIFKDVKEKGDEIICILLSSALSGTYQSATLAKSMVDYDKIYIIDSLTATICIKIMADYARKMAEENKSAQEIVQEIESMKSHVKCIATMDTLEYLYKGGRLSKAAATVGEAVNIKPIITLTEEGEVGILKKCIGKKQAVMQTKKMLQDMDIDQSFPIYSIYSYGTENSEILEEKLIKEGYKLKERLQIGPTIGTHIGPEAFGIIFVTKR